MGQQAAASYEVAIRSAEPRALRLAGSPQAWEREATFAVFQVANSDELQKLAKAQPHQLTEATVQAVASGVSLNPALGLAYLVPRAGKIRLEFGYQGFIQLATSTGAVVDVFVDTVNANDDFRRGVKNSVPYIDHEPADGERGEITGVYCLATLPSGRCVPCYMSRAEIDAIRKTSKSPAWNGHFAEMAKKTVIRRARKTWPRQIPALEKALAVDEFEEAGVDLSFDGAAVEAEFEANVAPETISEAQATQIQEWLDRTGANVDAFKRFFAVADVGELAPGKYAQAMAMLKAKAGERP